ncbi:hypothetical protein FVEG_14831 [Fusarium verticillioides 7600]|uniref:Uncharacterized protein n=1 Tax=Gibberella moniliformis (strain M3125 / FGSC 7600) TaxID=334819 RepID=W7LRC6_GIBM7|nr:hypothetical protein FVEG_14831 [Fusarium verticillioides 7600]EWG38064.1 hypothetical protein FVEG_14831 [Fusarium verticillioides 7600]
MVGRLFRLGYNIMHNAPLSRQAKGSFLLLDDTEFGSCFAWLASRIQKSCPSDSSCSYHANDFDLASWLAGRLAQRQPSSRLERQKYAVRGGNSSCMTSIHSECFPLITATLYPARPVSTATVSPWQLVSREREQCRA